MNEYQEKKNKLLYYKEKIMTMSDNKEKNKFIYGYYGLLVYLMRAGVIKKYQVDKYGLADKDTEKYTEYMVQRTRKKLNELAKFAPDFIMLYSKIINEYKNHDFESFKFRCLNKVNSKKMYGYLFEFFHELGDDVIGLYDKMAKNGNITLSSAMNSVAISANAIPFDDPFIVVSDTEGYFNFYNNLAHEMGHCYQFVLQKNKHNIEFLNIFNEVTSTLFEQLFFEFLKTKNIDSSFISSIEVENHMYYLNNFSIAKIIYKLIMQDSIYNINPFDLTYESDYPRDVLEDIVKDECGYIISGKRDIAFDEVFYATANVIVNKVISKMKTNFSSAWKEYKELITNVDKYPLINVLDEYFDVDLICDNIKTFMKNYRKR